MLDSMRDAGVTAVVLAAVAVAAATWALTAVVVGDLEVSVRGGPTESLGVGRVVVVAALGSLLGVLLAGLTQRTPRPRRVFLLASIVGLVLSLIPPLTNDTDTGSRAGLAAIHFAVAAVVIPLLARNLPDQQPAAD